MNHGKVRVIDVTIRHKDKGYLKEEYNSKIGKYSSNQFSLAMLQKQEDINCMERHMRSNQQQNFGIEITIYQNKGIIQSS
jgi:hypothetical protein